MTRELHRLIDIAESLGGHVDYSRVPMFADADRPLAARVTVQLRSRKVTVIRPTFRQAARDAESWIAAQGGVR